MVVPSLFEYPSHPTLFLFPLFPAPLPSFRRCLHQRRQWCGFVSHVRAACQRVERTCRGFTCGVVADRRSRSLLESHPGLKIALRLRRGRSWRGLQWERNRNFRVIFIPCVSLLHPRRDFPEKTFLPFLKFIGLFLPRCALPVV